MSKDKLRGVPYQQAGQVRQALAERDSATALGLTTRVEAANKTLENLGYADPESAPKVARDEPPTERRAAHERTETAEKTSETSDSTGRTSARGRQSRA